MGFPSRNLQFLFERRLAAAMPEPASYQPLRLTKLVKSRAAPFQIVNNVARLRRRNMPRNGPKKPRYFSKSSRMHNASSAVKARDQTKSFEMTIAAVIRRGAVGHVV